MTHSTLIPGALEGDDLLAWFDMEAPRIVAEAEGRAATVIPFSTSDGSDLWFAPAADMSLQAPDDAPEWLQNGPVFHNLDELQGALADVTGGARELRWMQANLCARAWLGAGDRKARREMLGTLGGYMTCSAKTAERRVQLALTYPPDLRMPDVSQAVYLAALRAADPCEVMEAALRFGWSAKEVKEHIDTGQAPTHREKLLAEDWPADADPEDVAALVHAAIRAAQRDGHPEHGALLELRVNVSAVWAASEAERAA